MDTLASRYGWSFSEISENMYWEDVYEMYELSANTQVLERNEKMKFDYMIHATSKKALDGWKDLSIPFPNRSWVPPKESKIDDLPQSFRRFKNASKASPEQVKRAKYVKKRVEENYKRMMAIQHGTLTE